MSEVSKPSVPVEPAEPKKKQTLKSNYTPNSHKVKEEAVEKANEEKRVQQVTTGNVTIKKPSIGKRIADSFKGDDVQNVGSYLLFDVMLPAAKTLISDMVTQGIERALFGESSTRPRPSSSRSGYQSYNRMHNPARQGFSGPATTSRLEVRDPNAFDDIILEYREDAVKVLDVMRDILDQYGVVSVADLRESVGQSGNFTDNKSGWYDLRNAGVARSRGGYVLNLPRPERLD